jgi:hypothetical protein
MKCITMPGGDLRYLRLGAGRTVVLLHTLRTQLEYFLPLVRELGDEFDVVVPDLPGHGQSAAPTVEYTAEYFTDTIEQPPVWKTCSWPANLSALQLRSRLPAGGTLAWPASSRSTASYSTPLARFIGAFMIALSLLVIQIARHRVEVLYLTALLVRVVLAGTAVWLYTETRDLLFLSISGIVGLGMVFTALGLIADRSIRSTSVRSGI